MRSARLAFLTVSLAMSGASGAAAGAATASGSAALALAGVVAPYSPLLSPADKNVVARLFAGNPGDGDAKSPYARKIIITADKIVCRISNVDITARSCELTFGTAKRNLKGREANEIFATEAVAGVPSDGAAGSIFESLSKLNCTLDPKEIRDNAGGGANCTFDTGN